MENQLEFNDPRSSAEARGKRLRVVRMMTGLPRKGFEEKYGISASTIQSWEAAKAGGLTRRGVERILHVLQREGVFCTLDWLMFGVGTPPQPTSLRIPQVREDHPHYGLPEDEIITKELLAFRTLNTDALDMVVADDGMTPFYQLGDYVAGKMQRFEDMNELIGLDCIVQTSVNQILLRRIKQSVRPGHCDLVCLNPASMATPFVLMEQKLVNVAPVIWHRKHNVKGG